MSNGTEEAGLTVGLDLRTYPVRLDSPATRLIRIDATAWQTATAHPPFGHSHGEPAPDISLHLQADVPEGIDAWNYPDRTYGQAEYLLDPSGYRALKSWPTRERSLPYRIIEGDQVFAPHAAGPQGIPWRCSTAAFLAQAAAVINAIDAAAVRREFSVAEMYELGIYKAHPSEDDDEVFWRVLRRLRQLATYYRGLADVGIDLIVQKD